MNRLGYIDWMRGLACVLMFQTHCYDSWLSPEARGTEWFYWSQRLGTFPAPLFLFLAGVSFALVTDKLRQKGVARNEIARKTMLRGGAIFGLALLFRLQEWLLGQPHAPWTDLLRVDILNLMGVSMVAMGALCWLAPGRAPSIAWAMAAMLITILAAPPVWTTWRSVLGKAPWPLESYINGAHVYPEPQPWLFPFFPWAGFAFAGLAVGFVLFSEAGRAHESRTVTLLGAAGAALALGAWLLDRVPVQFYAVYDFWHTSPNFFLIRLGMLLMILWGCYAWRRWGWGERGFSPIIQLGTTSLLVYWVHIQFVYGGLSIVEKRGQTVAGASLGLLVICAAMLLLSLAKTGWASGKTEGPARR